MLTYADTFVLQGYKWVPVATPFSKGLIRLLLNAFRMWSNKQVRQPLGSACCVQVGAWKSKNSWSALADVELCLYLLHALLLPQLVAVLIFSWTLPWHLTKPFFCSTFVWKLTNTSPFQMKDRHWYRMSYCLVRRDVYFKYLDLISLYWWQAEN